MALTRNFLKSMGLTDEQISAIIENHMDTVEGLKAERDSLKENATKLTEAQSEVSRLTSELEQAKKNGGDAAKVQADFDAFKQQVAAERLTAATDADLAAMAKEAGIQRESFQRMAVKTFDRDFIQRGEGDAITNRSEIIERMKKDYPDFIATDPSPRGPGHVDPPTNNPNQTFTREQIQKMSREEINKNWGAIKGNLASLE